MRQLTILLVMPMFLVACSDDGVSLPSITVAPTQCVKTPVPEGRLYLRDLMEHATQSRFVYRHSWRVGDLVIWDNKATMHRGRPFDDTKHRRELRRVTTLDLPA